MRLHLCGVRGSTPAPGPAFARVGGHTSCVAIAHDGEWRPRLLIDGGTGLRRVAELLGDAPFEGVLLLGHLHWDHTQGIPFFGAGDRPDARVDVHLPVAGGVAAHALDGMMSPPFFPIDAGGLQGQWSFHALDEGLREVEGFSGARQGDPPHRRAHVRVPRQRWRRDDGLRRRITVHSPSAVVRTAGGRITTRCARSPTVSTCCSTTPSSLPRSWPPARTSDTRRSTTPSPWRSTATSGGCCSTTMTQIAPTTRSMPSSTSTAVLR